MIRRRCPRADGDSEHGPRPSARSERAALRVSERPAGRGAPPASVDTATTRRTSTCPLAHHGRLGLGFFCFVGCARAWQLLDPACFWVQSRLRATRRQGPWGRSALSPVYHHLKLYNSGPAAEQSLGSARIKTINRNKKMAEVGTFI